MDINKLLVFDLKGDYAHFKKYYTTTSPLTFSIPPKTVLYGIIGAIIGLDKDSLAENYYLRFFQDKACKIAIQIKNPIKKTRIPLNLINTKEAIMMSRIKTRTQIRTEFVVDPHYRIYFYHEDRELYKMLKGKLKKHHLHYSISLGLSENLANYFYQGEVKVKKMINKGYFIPVSSVVNIDEDNIEKGDIDFNREGYEYFSEKVALEMKEDREVVLYGNLLYERNARYIYSKPDQYYQLESGENIIMI